jgi:glycerophosphoryl diester phosphodiesterase
MIRLPSVPALAALIAALALAGCASPRIDVQGHRGARGLAPENTLPAFARALALKVDTLELDVGVTRDGVVVVGHDPTLNPNIVRGPGGQWLEARGPAVHSLDYRDLVRYDVGRLKPGSNYARAHPAQVAVDGTTMPRLSDVFELVRDEGDRSVRFNIETKLSPRSPGETLAPEPFARAVISEIRRHGMARRSSIQSFDWRTLQVVQRVAPEIETVYLTAQRPNLNTVSDGSWTAGFSLRDHGSVPKLVKAAGGRTWSPALQDLTAETLAEAHALGLRVVVWTVNEPADIRRMLAMGVDGIISDRPDRVLQELNQ